MILTQEFVKRSIDLYNKTGLLITNDKVVTIKKPFYDVVADPGFRSAKMNLDNDRFKVLTTKTKRIISDIDPYGEENWDI